MEAPFPYHQPWTNPPGKTRPDVGTGALGQGNRVRNCRFRFYNSDKLVHFFNNNDSAGNLIRGQNDSTQQKADELAIRLEDAMVLSL